MELKLSVEANRLFKKIQKEWNICDETGLFLLGRAMECYDEMQTARRVIASEGEVILDRWGQPRLHPMNQKLKESRAHLLQFIKGLSLDMETLCHGKE